MTRRSAILIAVGGALLASCSEPAVSCNYRGEIIIPIDAAADDQARWAAENEALATRRFDLTIGNEESSRNYTKESLEKAASCP